jgi:hypothetical protein
MILPILFVCILIISTIIVDEYIAKHIFDPDRENTIPDHVVLLTENNETVLFYINLNNTAFSRKYRVNDNDNDNDPYYVADQGYFA